MGMQMGRFRFGFMVARGQFLGSGPGTVNEKVKLDPETEPYMGRVSVLVRG